MDNIVLFPLVKIDPEVLDGHVQNIFRVLAQIEIEKRKQAEKLNKEVIYSQCN